MKRFVMPLLGVVLLCAAGSTAASTPGDRILGVYKAIGEETKALSKVEFYKKGDCYEAKIVWLENPADAQGNPLCDILNPDPELRKVRADNIILVRGVKYDPRDKTWSGGSIYNPVTGKTYDVTITFDTSRRLKVRGYLGSTMFGKSFFWDKLE
jgi:uncharacterized protein (DUF2147 family)